MARCRCPGDPTLGWPPMMRDLEQYWTQVVEVLRLAQPQMPVAARRAKATTVSQKRPLSTIPSTARPTHTTKRKMMSPVINDIYPAIGSVNRCAKQEPLRLRAL